MTMTLAIALTLLAPLQDPTGAALGRLSKSPRHHAWVDVASGARKVRCFVAFPEAKDKVHAVVVVHENKGLTEWVRAVADRLAEAGYLALAPDLLSGRGPEGGNTESFAS